jgi:uncharacterized damage-inducible protein DinB
VADEDTRVDPPLAGSEAEVLVGFLEFHRATLERKVDGLDSAQLAQRHEPSSMTLGGMLKHLAYVEDWWFNQVFAGNPTHEPWSSVDWRADADWDWHSAAEQSSAELRALWEAEVAVSRRITEEALSAPTSLDTLSARESRGAPGTHFNLRWILVHMIEEYSRHNGHADLIRESIDGLVGE